MAGSQTLAYNGGSEIHPPSTLSDADIDVLAFGPLPERLSTRPNYRLIQSPYSFFGSYEPGLEGLRV